MQATMTPERTKALAETIEAGFIETRYAKTAHFYLHNLGLLRKTSRLFKDPRYGKVPVEVYVPTPKGRAAAS